MLIRLIVAFCFLIISIGCGRTLKNSVSKNRYKLVEYRAAKGVIIPDSIRADYFSSGKGRFTPTITQIKSAEKILKKKHKDLFEFPNFGLDKIRVPDSLNRYVRQYAGYYNGKGEKILLLNMLWPPYPTTWDNSKDSVPDMAYYLNWDFYWQSRWVEAGGGGSNFWRLEVNITTGDLGRMRGNGSS